MNRAIPHEPRGQEPLSQKTKAVFGSSVTRRPLILLGTATLRDLETGFLVQGLVKHLY